MVNKNIIGKQRIDSLQLVRGIVTLLVMFAHINLAVDAGWLHGIFIPGWCGVDCFFVLSGFLAIYVYKTDNTVYRHVVNRFIRIYPVNTIYTLIALLIKFIQLKVAGVGSVLWTDLNNGGLHNVVCSLLCLPTNPIENVMPVIPPAWTLPYTVLFYVAEIVLIVWGLKAFFAVCGIWCGLILYTVLGNVEFIYPFNVLMSPLFTEFFMGMLIAIVVVYGNDLHETIKKYIFSGSFVIGFGGICLSWMGTAYNVRSILEIHRVWKFGIPFALLLLGMVGLNQFISNYIIRLKIGKFFMACGRMSFSIYLSHYTILYALLSIIRKYNFNISSGWLVMLTAAVCFCIGAIGYKFVEIPCQKLLKNLLFGRRQVKAGTKYKD